MSEEKTTPIADAIKKAEWEVKYHAQKAADAQKVVDALLAGKQIIDPTEDA